MTETYFEIWLADRKSMLNIMIENMLSDLKAGYDYFGKSISRQKAMIDGYAYETESQLTMLRGMDVKAQERWCRNDMRKRGVID